MTDPTGTTGTDVEADPVAADAGDPLAALRDRFSLPPDLVYLDGNSLGPLPRGVATRLSQVVTREWGTSLIRGWNDHGWIDLPVRVGDRIAALVGAAPGTVVAVDSTSVNVAKAVSAALRLRPDRQVVLSDSGNFPTDLYMAQGVVNALAGDAHLEVVAPDEVEGRLSGPDASSIALLLLTHVDYRTGRMHDMSALTAAAHRAGAVTVWDLAHSAGAVPVDLESCRADFAVGCTYKYLNGGPGSPAFVYVAPRHAQVVDPLLSGWMGHHAPFAFEPAYRPAPGIRRMQVGTAPILALAALDAALDVWEAVDMADVRAKSTALAERFVTGVERRCGHHGLELASPRDPSQRGSQISYRHPEGYAVIQALIAEGVIGDFREPDIMRFGFCPLYLRHHDVETAVDALATVLDDRRWDTADYKVRAAVT